MKIKQFTIVPKEEFTDITDIINKEVSSRKQGLCLIYSKHTTATIGILENEKLLRIDMHDFFERLASSNCLYRHDDLEHRDVPPEERRNGFSHLRAMLLNHQQIIPIVNGKLDLGHWQRVFYIETDLGKENRTFNICLIVGE
jgi:secondary thiamine-phosphate synthase enzyme